MRLNHVLLASLAGASMVAPVANANAAVAAAQPARPSASKALADLFAASDAGDLKRNPISALARGDTSRAGHIGNPLADEYYAAERAAAEADLKALAAIDRAKLTAEEQISYDVFKWQRSMDLRGLQPDMLALTAVRPIDHFNGFHTFMAELSSGQSLAPYKSVKDYRDGLSRFDDFVVIADTAVARMKEGVATGVVQPKLIVTNSVEQLDQMLAGKPEDSAFFQPLKAMPKTVPAAEQARLRSAYLAAINGKLYPALKRLRDYMATDYLAAARPSVGLLDMKGGPELYRYRVAVSTTTDMTPEQIHQIGLDEVKRLHAEMEKVKADVGYTGTLKDFFEHIRTDPKFKPASREWLQQEYVRIGQRVDKALPKLFSTMPKAPLDIRPVPALTEKGAARGSYERGTPDGSRPGVFYFNAYDLPSRTTPSMETLYLHEGAPGHHFQLSLAQENTKLPNFQRFGGITAFAEGWGLYSETLGKELGVYTDPYQYFGYLDSQLFRAIRLVVDTGIHAKGWTRDQTIQYILDNSSRGRSNATAETERYIAIPGQALSYKVGQMKISELRARAERELGEKFDARDFHAQVLMSGSLPLAVLEMKIDRWIAAKKAS
jgi:uncharacterized protein (DUF885 family)